MGALIDKSGKLVIMGHNSSQRPLISSSEIGRCAS